MTVAASLDTNILVRYIVKDDDRQSSVVAKIFEQHIRRSESLWVPVTVMLELEFESEAAIEQALSSYEDGSADYAEYLHLALARKGDALPFLTFDQQASKAAGVRLLI